VTMAILEHTIWQQIPKQKWMSGSTNLQCYWISVVSIARFFYHFNLVHSLLIWLPFVSTFICEQLLVSYQDCSSFFLLYVSLSIIFLAVIGILWLVGCVGLDECSYSTLSLVSTWIGDRVRAGKPSRYVASQLGRLSLLPSVG